MKLVEAGRLILSLARAMEDMAHAAKAVCETFLYFKDRYRDLTEKPPCECDECLDEEERAILARREERRNRE